MTYRVGHHSTSDDSTVYRNEDEIKAQEQFSAIERLKAWLESQNLWSEQQHTEFKAEVNKEVLRSLKDAEVEKKPPIEDLFTDVYKEIPTHLKEQYEELKNHLEEYADKYKLDMFSKL